MGSFNRSFFDHFVLFLCIDVVVILPAANRHRLHDQDTANKFNGVLITTAPIRYLDISKKV